MSSALDGGPQLKQVFQVPVQLFSTAADTSGAGNHAHAVGHVELGYGFLELGAVLTFDATRNAPAARVVRHQHQVTAGEADKGGQCSALVAAFILVDLDNDFLTFLQGILDAGVADINAGLEVGAGDFLERQEAVAVVAVIDKGGFEAGLDAGDDTLVNIAFALLFTGGFDVEINQFLTIDDGNAQLFGLRCIEQHAFHFLFSRAQGFARDAHYGSRPQAADLKYFSRLTTT